MDAREVALQTLYTCERQGGWSDGALKRGLAAAKLDARDAALATRLCFGVLQHRMLLDFYLEHYSKLPLKRMEAKVAICLRLGAYQMLFLNRIPHSAAVSSAVALTRAHSKNQKAAGMVNGILRSFGRNLDSLPPVPREDLTEYLSITYSHPRWLVGECLSALGAEGAEAFFQANNEPAPITAMVNTTKISAQALLRRLEEEQVRARPHSWLMDCLILGETGSLEAMDSFQEGLFYIQDPAARLAVWAAEPGPGCRILDACAAPGGKSFAAAIAMENRGELLSCDLHPNKMRLIELGARRLGLSCVQTRVADGSVRREEWEGAFDIVFADVPCSGLGVIRKKPDIRYKDPRLLEGLPTVQGKILENVSAYVKPGGVLLYSTCTILRRENEQVVERFLKGNRDFVQEGFLLPGPVGETEGMITLWPHVHQTDGFFIAKMRKIKKGPEGATP